MILHSFFAGYTVHNIHYIVLLILVHLLAFIEEIMPAKRDPNKPRGRMTGYAYFVQTCREEHKRKHPDEQVIFAEFSKKCAKRWKVFIVHITS